MYIFDASIEEAFFGPIHFQKMTTFTVKPFTGNVQANRGSNKSQSGLVFADFSGEQTQVTKHRDCRTGEGFRPLPRGLRGTDDTDRGRYAKKLIYYRAPQSNILDSSPVDSQISPSPQLIAKNFPVLVSLISSGMVPIGS